MEFSQCQVERHCCNKQILIYFVASEFTQCGSDLPGLFQRYQKATKKTILRGHQNNRMPYWYEECKTLHRTLLQCLKMKHDSILAARTLLKLERWMVLIRASTFTLSSKMMMMMVIFYSCLSISN